jgi:hypothetical protein
MDFSLSTDGHKLGNSLWCLSHIIRDRGTDLSSTQKLVNLRGDLGHRRPDYGPRLRQ